MDTSSFIRAIKFYRNAKTINSIHSPLLFELVNTIFSAPKTYYADSTIEYHRQRLLASNESIEVIDYGAGSYDKADKSSVRKVSRIAKRATSNKVKCRFLRKLVFLYKPKMIIEFGTNLGISGAYMKSAAGSKVIYHTIEADPNIAGLASDLFKKMQFENYEIHQQVFSDFIAQKESLLASSDFVYLDGDHQYESTLKNFKAICKAWTRKKGRQIIIVDDINWSEGMARAWEEIKATANCRTLDFFKLGLVLFDDHYKGGEHIRVVPRWAKPWSMGFWA